MTICIVFLNVVIGASFLRFNEKCDRLTATAAITPTDCGVVNTSVLCLTELAVQCADMPAKRSEGCLYCMPVLSDKKNKCRKCVRIVSGKTVNLSNMIKHLIKSEEKKGHVSSTVVCS